MDRTREPSGRDFPALLRAVHARPDGRRAEILGRGIVPVEPRPLRFRPVMKLLRERLLPHVPEGQDVEVAPFLFVFPESGRAFGPDLYVVDEEAFGAPGRHGNGSALSLVAELTSGSTKETDWTDHWTDRAAAYGRVVPVYLVLNMQEGQLTIFRSPSEQGYRARRTVPFGSPVPVPAPFDFTLDTIGFEAGVAD
ncbi:Uma2 family endonuclease [Streptomyces alkaliphilus]|uniref:Uma2 family endonuclease n=1 Tax=Streptomyces alkaliphilus TaxID=1472722 RepID=A0A7W3Y293_9ACTN|nr:Uma2 family endonuclease [Streptomyces alkaliphilus]MBB0245308.1 Uma2 family endonuclease [Streptomyces alkaliphilus]